LNPALLFLLGGVGVATGLALLAPFGWPFELFSHFRVQYAVAALLLAALLAWRRLGVPSVLAVVLASWHALPGAQGLLAAPLPPDCAGPAFTVATANVRSSSERRGPFLAWLDARPADVVVIQEVTAAWASEFSARSAYPHQHVLSREDPYGIAVLSRWPLESVSPVDLAGDGLPSLAGVVNVGGQRVRFLGLHTRWPITPELARARDEALRSAAELVRAADGPVVLLGDLNLSPGSPVFARLLGDAGLRDAMKDSRWQPTWAVGFWPLALRIDHVLVSSDLCVERAEVGPPVESDHRPVIARLRAQSRPGAAAMVEPAGTLR